MKNTVLAVTAAATLAFAPNFAAAQAAPDYAAVQGACVVVNGAYVNELACADAVVAFMEALGRDGSSTGVTDEQLQSVLVVAQAVSRAPAVLADTTRRATIVNTIAQKTPVIRTYAPTVQAVASTTITVVANPTAPAPEPTNASDV